MISTTPLLAPEANVRDKTGFRRSKSTRTVRAPDRAASNASAAVTVDFPSFGRVEVKPKIRFRPVFETSTSSASLMEQISSVNRELSIRIWFDCARNKGYTWKPQPFLDVPNGTKS